MIEKELRESVQQEVTKHFKPKVLEKRVPIDPKIAEKVYACLNNPTPPKKLPSDYNPHIDKGPPTEK